MKIIKLQLYILVYIVLSFFLSSCDDENEFMTLEDLESFSEIWSNNQHCAFTTLAEYNESYFCAFREANAHVPTTPADYGIIRILQSKDGNNWKSLGTIVDENYDLRDPKLVATKEGELMLIYGCSKFTDGKFDGNKSRVTFIDNYDISNYSQINLTQYDINIENDANLSRYWLWRVRNFEDGFYGIAYRNGDAILVHSNDGINYKMIKTLDIGGNEADIALSDNGDLMIVIRSEYGNGFIGTSSYPYLDWQWNECNYLIQCPEIFKINNIAFVVGRSIYGTTIFYVSKNVLEPIIALPSEGDNAYPGSCIVDDEVWISYYSGTEKCSIYFVKIKIAELLSRIS